MTLTTRKQLALAATGVTAAIALAGCTSNVDQKAAEADKADGEAQFETVGLTVQALDNPFFVAVEKGARAKAEEYGATLNAVGANQDVSQQSNQIDTFLQQGVDLIVLNAADSKGIGPAVERAVNQGVPVVAVDVGAAGGTAATVTSDNEQAGQLACQYIVDRLEGQGDIAIIDGTPITSITDRMNGCQSVLDENPGINVVASQKGDNGRDQGLSIATDILTAHPDIDAIFAVNDPTALGAALAVKQHGANDTFISAVDGSPDAVEEMKSEGIIAATVAQDPQALAEKAVELGHQVVQGEELEEKDIKLPVKLVTKDDLDSYDPWGTKSSS
jgi:ribose transport system substrate-binding protein